MPFLSKQASAAINTTSTGGGYLNLSKLPDKGQVRLTVLDGTPIEYYEVWGTAGDVTKPFRFPHDPTPEDITVELGDFEPREALYGNGGIDKKFCISCPIFNYDTGKVQVWSISQKTIIKELDDISQMEDYDRDITTVDIVITKEIQSSGIPAYKLRPVPKKKGSENLVDASWIEAKESGFELERLLTGGNPFKAV